ncbi:MAG: YfiH family protein [Cellvibrionaceae bacterium]|jgi:YfiH family protein
MIEVLAEGGIRYFRVQQFPSNLVHGVIGRTGGVGRQPFESLNLSSSVPDDEAAVHENRRRAYGTFGRSTETLVHAHLVHDNHVARVTKANQGEVIPLIDALITNDPGCGLTMNYADCAPILIYDPVKQAIGLGHAGWAGTVRDIPGAMVAAMQAAFGSDPADLLGAVGPCISADVYEVGQNVIDAVTQAFPEHVPELLIPQPNRPRPHFDLPKANLINFQRAGVEQVELSGLCTGSQTDLFFSHRAEKGKTGRFGVVMILPEQTV